MKRILFRAGIALCLILMGNGIGHAQTQRLVVWQKNGEKVYYDLSEEPKTTFEGTDIVITTTTLSVNYPLQQVLRYTYELMPTGVEAVESGRPVRISQKDDALLLENLQQGTAIQVYSMDGRLIRTERVGENAITRISLAGYTSGVYVVKVNDVTYKIMKR